MLTRSSKGLLILAAILVNKVAGVGFENGGLPIFCQNWKRDFIHRFLSNERYEDNQHDGVFLVYCLKSIQVHTI